MHRFMSNDRQLADTSAHRSATMVNLKTAQPTHWYTSLQELHMWQSNREI